MLKGDVIGQVFDCQWFGDTYVHMNTDNIFKGGAYFLGETLPFAAALGPYPPRITSRFVLSASNLT